MKTFIIIALCIGWFAIAIALYFCISGFKVTLKIKKDYNDNSPLLQDITLLVFSIIYITCLLYNLRNNFRLCNDAFMELLKMKSKINELLLDTLSQACERENDGIIDNMCISTYEEACEYLTQEGYLKKINDRAYKIKKWKSMIKK